MKVILKEESKKVSKNKNYIKFKYKEKDYWYVFDYPKNFNILKKYNTDGSNEKKAYSIWKTILNRVDSKRYLNTNVFNFDPRQNTKVQSMLKDDKKLEKAKEKQHKKHKTSKLHKGTLNLNAGEINRSFLDQVKDKKYSRRYTGVATIKYGGERPIKGNYLFVNGKVHNVYFVEPVFDEKEKFKSWKKYPIARIQITDKDIDEDRENLSTLGLRSKHIVLTNYRFWFPQGIGYHEISSDDIKYLLANPSIKKYITNPLKLPNGKDYSSYMTIEKTGNEFIINSKGYSKPSTLIQQVKNSSKSNSFLDIRHTLLFSTIDTNSKFVFYKNDEGSFVKKVKYKNNENLEDDFKVSLKLRKIDLNNDNPFNSGEEIKIGNCFFVPNKAKDIIKLEYSIGEEKLNFDIDNRLFKAFMEEIAVGTTFNKPMTYTTFDKGNDIGDFQYKVDYIEIVNVKNYSEIESLNQDVKIEPLKQDVKIDQEKKEDESGSNSDTKKTKKTKEILQQQKLEKEKLEKEKLEKEKLEKEKLEKEKLEKEKLEKEKRKNLTTKKQEDETWYNQEKHETIFGHRGKDGKIIPVRDLDQLPKDEQPDWFKRRKKKQLEKFEKEYKERLENSPLKELQDKNDIHNNEIEIYHNGRKRYLYINNSDRTSSYISLYNNKGNIRERLENKVSLTIIGNKKYENVSLSGILSTPDSFIIKKASLLNKTIILSATDKKQEDKSTERLKYKESHVYIGKTLQPLQRLSHIDKRKSKRETGKSIKATDLFDPEWLAREEDDFTSMTDFLDTIDNINKDWVLNGGKDDIEKRVLLGKNDIFLAIKDSNKIYNSGTNDAWCFLFKQKADNSEEEMKARKENRKRERNQKQKKDVSKQKKDVSKQKKDVSKPTVNIKDIMNKDKVIKRKTKKKNVTYEKIKKIISKIKANSEDKDDIKYLGHFISYVIKTPILDSEHVIGNEAIGEKYKFKIKKTATEKQITFNNNTYTVDEGSWSIDPVKFLGGSKVVIKKKPYIKLKLQGSIEGEGTFPYDMLGKLMAGLIRGDNKISIEIDTGTFDATVNFRKVNTNKK
jgi:flagellar biosynthesis GTPase FlhF